LEMMYVYSTSRSREIPWHAKGISALRLSLFADGLHALWDGWCGRAARLGTSCEQEARVRRRLSCQLQVRQRVEWTGVLASMRPKVRYRVVLRAFAGWPVETGLAGWGGRIRKLCIPNDRTEPEGFRRRVRGLSRRHDPPHSYGKSGLDGSG
jgi:hypothetical protein